MFCGNCGRELEAEAKFCPDCGCEVKPIPEQIDQAAASMVLDQSEAGTGADAKPKRKWSRKRRFMAVAGVIMILIAMVATFYSNDGYADGLVEIDSATYGLSTTVTIEEFIESYNQLIREDAGLERGEFYDVMMKLSGAISLEDAEVDHVLYGELAGTTIYSWPHSLGYIHHSIYVVCDNATKYVVGGGVNYFTEQYQSNNVPDEARNQIFTKFFMVLNAAASLDKHRYDEWSKIILSLLDSISLYENDFPGAWQNGLQFIYGFYEADPGISSLTFFTMSKEAYKEMYQPDQR